VHNECIVADGGKALLLDYSGNLLAHGLPDMGVRWSLEGRETTPGETKLTAKLCPGCEAIVAVGEAVCPECGHAFPRALPREIEGMAAGAITVIDHEQIARLKAMPYREILSTARTFDDLKRIAAVRCYADGWVYRAARERGIGIPRRERGALLPPSIPTTASCGARR
jgi:hypothetical protein